MKIYLQQKYTNFTSRIKTIFCIFIVLSMFLKCFACKSNCHWIYRQKQKENYLTIYFFTASEWEGTNKKTFLIFVRRFKVFLKEFRDNFFRTCFVFFP